MNKSTTFFTSGALVLGLCATTTTAQTSDKPISVDPATRTATQETHPAVRTSEAPARASEIIGKSIAAESGEKIWTIKDLAIAPTGDLVAFVQREDDTMIGIPFANLEARMTKSAMPEAKAKERQERVTSGETPEIMMFSMIGDRALFDAAPSFKDAKSVDVAWLTRSIAYFAGHEVTDAVKDRMVGKDDAKAAPITDANANTMKRPVLIDTLIGKKVVTGEGANLGDIEDVAIDLGTHRIAYVVVSTGGVLGMGETLHAVSYDGLTANDDSTMGLAMTSDGLANQPILDLDRLAPHPLAAAALGDKLSEKETARGGN
ncbi:MAG: PRC-barrel domain-containing protein [Planctomycetes bacterium]|nr:PRC-barrel domain-containing protein [Planctomycetota bacterium]